MLQNVTVWPNSVIRAALFIRLTMEARARETVKKKKVVYPLLWGLFEIKIQAKFRQRKCYPYRYVLVIYGSLQNG